MEGTTQNTVCSYLICFNFSFTNKADYILAVKENQKQLLEEIIDEFKFSKEIEEDIHIDLGHGRIETRKCAMSPFRVHADQSDRWAIDDSSTT